MTVKIPVEEVIKYMLSQCKTFFIYSVFIRQERGKKFNGNNPYLQQYTALTKIVL